ncbi:MAG: GDP-mannose 4,6-dehydratase [Dehalococcoidia bacterium]|nr:GDP-mannose 4,6-dehydratase [Dehalococcoidia bacterium]
MKKALVTGITGQDGIYLAEYLLSQGYDVFGMIRGQNNPRRATVEQAIPQAHIIEGDLLDQGSLIAAISKTQPDEVYNLGAISFVPLSFKQPELTGEVTGLGVTRMLEAIRIVNSKIRFYQASSSEMFGAAKTSPQNEATPFHPRSPYGVAKVYGYYITLNYREAYGVFACNGILFNHESPRRGLDFVTRKISRAAARIKLGLEKKLRLGNLDARRDWGFAGDYVRAMHLMLQQPQPDDYVIGTGESHTVRDFCNAAFRHLGLDWREYVVQDQEFTRPSEVDTLCGDSSKAKRILGWEPSVQFPDLVRMMVEADLADLKHEMGPRAASRPSH